MTAERGNRAVFEGPIDVLTALSRRLRQHETGS
jgi:hypothetical protein